MAININAAALSLEQALKAQHYVIKMRQNSGVKRDYASLVVSLEHPYLSLKPEQVISQINNTALHAVSPNKVGVTITTNKKENHVLLKISNNKVEPRSTKPGVHLSCTCRH